MAPGDWRTTGSRLSSAICINTSWCEASQPNAHAMAQQLLSINCGLAPRSSCSTGDVASKAFWWQWPWTRIGWVAALRASSYGSAARAFLRWCDTTRGTAMADERSTTPIDLGESVAGEEDPGASIDLAASAPATPAASDQPAGPPVARAAGPTPPMSPGDEAPAGTPGTGEDICRSCGSSCMLNGGACPDCDGTGKVTVGIGGA
ncbi:MAG: hypothetical protein NVS2B4_08040 [Ramlibacter sp.]